MSMFHQRYADRKGQELCVKAYRLGMAPPDVEYSMMPHEIDRFAFVSLDNETGDKLQLEDWRPDKSLDQCVEMLNRWLVKPGLGYYFLDSAINMKIKNSTCKAMVFYKDQSFSGYEETGHEALALLDALIVAVKTVDKK